MSPWNTKGTLLAGTGDYSHVKFPILRGHCWYSKLGNTATSSWNTKGTLLEELGNTATSSWNTKGTLSIPT